MAFISTVLADFISLVAEPIQQKPVIPAFADINMGIRVRLCSYWCSR